MKNKFRFLFAALLLTVFISAPTQDLSAQQDPVMISIDSAVVSSDGTVEVPITVAPNSNTIGAITVDVQYDSDVIHAVSCELNTGENFSVCNPETSGIVVATVISLSGISTEFTLAPITFGAVGELGASSALSLSVETLTDIGGNDLNYTVANGQIDVGVLGSFTSCANVKLIPQSECEALETIQDEIYEANPSASLGDWLTTDTPCSWSRITCTNGHVTSLHLNKLGLTMLPAGIESLTNLDNVSLTGCGQAGCRTVYLPVTN